MTGKEEPDIFIYFFAKKLYSAEYLYITILSSANLSEIQQDRKILTNVSSETEETSDVGFLETSVNIF